jgi:hypothetical protein
MRQKAWALPSKPTHAAIKDLASMATSIQPDQRRFVVLSLAKEGVKRV